MPDDPGIRYSGLPELLDYFLKFIIGENVDGLLSRRLFNEKYFDVIKKFNDLGYDVYHGMKCCSVWGAAIEKKINLCWRSQ